MIRSLLVALDGTPFGEHVLPLAANLARRCKALLHLVHVHVPMLIGADKNTLEEAEYLDSLAQRVADHAPEVEVRTFVMERGYSPNVAEALNEYIREYAIDLVVMNSHARGGLARWWMGNVADDLVHHTSHPILVAPALDHDLDWEVQAPIRHVLVPLDGSPLAEQVLQSVRSLSAEAELECTLLRVVEPAPVPVTDPILATAAPVDPSLEVRMRSAGEYLTRLAARLRNDEPRLKVHTHVLLDTDPADAICAFLRRRATENTGEPPIDLLAAATHAREGLARLLMGSVADRVLQHTPVPLLLQHPAVEVCPESEAPESNERNLVSSHM